MTEDTAPTPSSHTRPLPAETIPSDMALLLRADAEQRWLHREVIPVLRQLEATEPLPGEQVAAALAYLEDSWNEALLRARHTEAAGERESRTRERGEHGGPGEYSGPDGHGANEHGGPGEHGEHGGADEHGGPDRQGGHRRLDGLGEDAVRYHTAVRALRGIVAERVVAHVAGRARAEPACARIA